ncbi:MAG: hypothetical protein HYR76_13095 [Ignavibacteria bacterium]|nr:hypothetical protein [Ignavibacteria bacterium]MBI3766386.1 hypothetical protein [Ignavibacteriales bacterium]
METSYNETDLSGMFLPVGDMLQVRKISMIANGTIVGEQPLTEEDWIFPLHFPDDPIFPGSLMIEGAGQLIAIWGWHQGLRGKPRLVKVSAEFKSPVTAADKLITYTGTMTKRQNICIGSVEISVGDRPIGTVTGSLIVLQG